MSEWLKSLINYTLVQRGYIDQFQVRIKLLEAQLYKAQLDNKLIVPALPRITGEISDTELYKLLLAKFGGESMPYVRLLDERYDLTSLAEYQRFLAWYKDTDPYYRDDYDCEDFAWLLRAAALRWMQGRLPVGWICASGSEEGQPFEEHGFNFVVDERLDIYLCDELCVVAPEDEFMLVYPVKASTILA